MSAVTTASVHIDGKILTITGNTGCEHLVLEAREVLDKHFNFDSNEAALLGPDTPSPALAAVEELENSSQVCEVAAVTSNDGCAVAELMETQEGAALPAQVVTSPALVSAADTGAEDTEACAGGESVEAALASAETEQMEAAVVEEINTGAEDTEASTGGESVELPGLVLASVEAEDIETAVGAEDTVTEDTETVSKRSYDANSVEKHLIHGRNGPITHTNHIIQNPAHCVEKKSKAAILKDTRRDVALTGALPSCRSRWRRL